MVRKGKSDAIGEGGDGRGKGTGQDVGKDGTGSSTIGKYLPGLGFLSNKFLCPLMMLQA